ncbi:Gpi1-domain-containing protein [Exidia glandulosa HHB12029]|uniref:Gpi1-domain-containing protein n=1 Tax=Exidia glandulosa HHB12029 TaxID=1314781 RepID=A0A165FEN2_EXIGL|nr:Gpi1-domain-containing protein [Exidia glandulosa HHB12029]
MKVFWPRRAPRTGTVYGWINGEIAVVAAVLDVQDGDGDDALARIPSTSKLIEQAGSAPHIIATCDASQDPWIVFKGGAESVDIVLYDPPQRHKLHFFSLEPVSLHRAVELPDPRAAKLLPLDTEPRPPRMSHAVNQMNSADDFAVLLRRADSREAVGNRILDWMFTRTQRSLPVIVRAMEHHVIPPARRLSSITATASQVHLRALQVVYAANEMERAQQQQGRNSWSACGPYVSFWNCVWLLLNDCILGYAVGNFLMENHVWIGSAIGAAVQWTAHECIAESLAWLDSWPVGLKLNTELSSFFHIAFLAITRIFSSAALAATPFFPSLVFLLGAIGSCSLSLLLALFTDLLTVLSLNITLSYLAAAAILRFEWYAAYALFTLFRGKRKNVLRGRVDSWEYDIDQLILGTVLFTLVAFLMPTVLVYYAFFASLRFLILLAYAGIEVLMACVNYFPLFALMLRIKDPARLPGGICFVPASVPEFPGAWRLQNQPLAPSAILSHFGRYFSSMARHYHPGRIIWRFVSGGHLDPMPSSTDHLFR